MTPPATVNLRQQGWFRWLGYFLFFSLLLAGTRVAFSPVAPPAYETFLPGASERIDEGLRDRLRAARALKALDAVAPPAPVAAPALSAAAQLVVLALPAQRGVPDDFHTILERIVTAPAMAKVALPLRVAVDWGRTEPRGTYADGIVTVAALNNLWEMVLVLTHEIGHRVDITTLGASTGSTDLSETFYAASWQSAQTKLKGSRAADFVSGYAQTNRYEDFAESFVFYVFHNRDFLARTMHHEPLRKKYDFFRTVVFPDGTYVGTSFAASPLPSYVWDVTKSPIDVTKYLNYADR